MLARQLQQEFDNTWQSNRSQSHPKPMDMPQFDLAQLDPAQLTELIKLVKKGMLPIMLEQIKQVQVPDIDETVGYYTALPQLRIVDVPKVGQITVGLHGLQMEEAVIKEEDINVELQGNRVVVSVYAYLQILQLCNGNQKKCICQDKAFYLVLQEALFSKAQSHFVFQLH